MLPYCPTRSLQHHKDAPCHIWTSGLCIAQWLIATIYVKTQDCYSISSLSVFCVHHVYLLYCSIFLKDYDDIAILQACVLGIGTCFCLLRILFARFQILTVWAIFSSYTGYRNKLTQRQMDMINCTYEPLASCSNRCSCCHPYRRPWRS